jgi:AAA15 family ATPase/GTPase
MLIKFICQNIFSINDEVEFRMFKSPTRIHNNHVYEVSNKIKVLKSAIMYGANASGKTNFVKALSIGRDFIFSGPNNPNRIDIPQFKLDDGTIKPSLFEYTFMSNNQSYVYGFELDKSRVISEWCYKLQGLTPKILFERKTFENGVIELNYGSRQKNKDETAFMKFCEQATRPTQLFLTTLINNNTKYLLEVIDWFKKLTIIYPQSIYGNLFSVIANDEFYKSFQEILVRLGIDIDELELKEYLLDEAQVNIPNSLKIRIKKEISDDKSIHLADADGQFLIFSLNKEKEIVVTKIQAKRRNLNGDLINFDLSEESDGTRRLFDLIPMLLDFKMNDSIYIVDEIDRSFHSLLSKSIFRLFYNLSGAYF